MVDAGREPDMSFQDVFREFAEKHPPHRVKARTCLYLQDKVTGDNVEIVSENLEVKVEPVKEKTRGNQ